jgi:hypothetical protein
MIARRIVLPKNDLFADFPAELLEDNISSELIQEAREIINEYLQNQTVRTPEKDKRFFIQMRLNEVLSLENIRNLCRKLTHKYITKSGKSITR